MVALIGGVVGYAVLKSGSKPKTYPRIPTALADSGGSITQGGTLGVDSGLGSSLQSNLGGSSTGGSGSSGSSNAAASVPGPDQFAQYDQYKTGEHALYSDLVVGTGSEIEVGTKVAVTYQGWLTNGKQFDASPTGDDGKLQAYKLTIGEHKVILGWEEGLLGMKVGGKRRLIIPPVVGYGAQGQDPIPPNAVLVFDVILHDAL